MSHVKCSSRVAPHTAPDILEAESLSTRVFELALGGLRSTSRTGHSSDWQSWQVSGRQEMFREPQTSELMHKRR